MPCQSNLTWQGIPLLEFIEGISMEKRTDETQTTEFDRAFFSHEKETGVRKKLESPGYI